LWRVGLFICFATPPEFVVVFGLVGTIAFNTSRSLYFAQKSCVTPFPEILVLRDVWIHVGSSNGHDISADIEAPVDKHFGLTAALNIPYVYPDN